jgi:hypothetical protein
MANEILTVVWRHDEPHLNLALELIQFTLRAGGGSTIYVEVGGENLPLTVVRRRLKSRNTIPFRLWSAGFEFHLASIRSHDIDFLSIRATHDPAPDWDGVWLPELIRHPDFVMAWIVDADYERWQNATDPAQYSAAGLSSAHLPTLSNGLPPPLERSIIDISLNPGRRMLRHGYIEVVGAVMWLGEHFWTLTSASPGVVASAGWVQASSPWPGVLRIAAAGRCFTTPDGASGDIQDRLRRLLFPKRD